MTQTTMQLLEEEYKELTATLSQMHCIRCKQDEQYSPKSCQQVCNEEAQKIQSKFLVPLRVKIKLAVTSAVALGICCCCLLTFPMHHNKHHILETYVKTATNCLKDCWPKIKKDISGAIAQIEAKNAHASEKNTR